MIYVQIDENNNVLYQHYMPFDDEHGMYKTEDELLETGFLVENIQEETREGFYSQLKYNPENNTLYHEFLEIPKSKEELQAEEIENLKAAQAETDTVLLELMETLLM